MSRTQVTLILALCCVVSFQQINSCPNIISREEWNAREPTSRIPLQITPPPYVVVHHSDGPQCTTSQICKSRIKNIQDYHMDTRGWDDIGYNFLIGGDGNIYEGRGYGTMGSHVINYNRKSIGICLIGNFMRVEPPQVQLIALKGFIECMKNDTKIISDYHLIGHRQGSSTLCPGNKLFNIIETWSNFEPHPS